MELKTIGLLSDYPELCEEWNYDRNARNGLFPNEVAPHSDLRLGGSVRSAVMSGKVRLMEELG